MKQISISIYFGSEPGDPAALIMAFVIGRALLVVHSWTKDSRMDWSSVTGEVLETRLKVMNLIEQQYRPSLIVIKSKHMLSMSATAITTMHGSQFQSSLPTKHFWNSGYHNRKASHTQCAGRPGILHMWKLCSPEIPGCPIFCEANRGIAAV